MADIKNLKITEDKTRGKHVADLPVNPTENGMSAQELQGHFDALPKLAIESFNDLVDALEENGVGEKITPQSVGARPNANLLHNWYFGNPVNRNGQSEYNGGAKICIDRWRLEVGTRLTVKDGFCTVSGAWNIREDYINSVVGQLTLSVLVNNVVAPDSTKTPYIRLHDVNGANAGSIMLQNGSSGLFSKTITSISGISKVEISVSGQESVENSIDVVAVKLEYGDTQTLAHQENGVWVLNEIPDYAEQMAICMQYDKTTGAYTGITAPDVGALPLDGSVAMSGQLTIAYDWSNISFKNTEWTQSAGISMNANNASMEIFSNINNDYTNRNGLTVIGYECALSDTIQAFCTKNGVVQLYRLFGEHNKPSGSYTGNGSVTERKITIGGVGKWLFIKNPNHGMAIVNDCCAYVATGSIWGVQQWAQCRFENGVLTLATTNNVLNANGNTIYYDVL